MHSKMVVKSHEPARLRLVLAGAALLLLAGMWGLFDWGRKAGGYDSAAAARTRGEMTGRISALEEENESLRRELALLRTADKVDREAYGLVSTELDDLQSQIAELNEELAFYRGIMMPLDGKSGLQIQAVQLHPGGESGKYRLRLVLVQAGRHDGRVKGAVAVNIVGGDSANGEPGRLALSKLSGEGDKLGYSFRYFQILERDFTLPDGFVPAEVEVNLTPARKGETVTGSFPWLVTES